MAQMNILPTDREIIRRGRHFGAWRNPDGSQGQRIYARPIHRRIQDTGDSIQDWILMDNCIVAPWQFRVDGKALDFTLGKLQAKTVGGAVRDLSLADTVTVSGSGDKLTCYPYPGVEIDYEVGMAGVKETIRINSLPALPGGSFNPKWITISGQCSVASGQWEGLMRKDATFSDAQGNTGPGYLLWDGDSFELGIDLAWLYAAPLPVVIDPTISAEGNDVTLAKSIPDPSGHPKLLTKFDVSSIPDDAIFSAGTFNNYCTQKGPSSNATCHRGSAGISQTWTEASSAANLHAITLGATLDTKNLSTGLTLNAYAAWNVLKGDTSDGIEADVSGGNQYFTPILKASTVTPVLVQNNVSNNLGPQWLTYAIFNSAEAATFPPYLDVTYTTPPPAGASFAVII